MSDGSERPITFISRTLSNAERNYSQIEKEGLAIVYAVKKLHQYLYGRHFNLITDHKPLLGILSENKAIPSMTAARIQRWAIILSAYNYTLQYRTGIENGNADFASRFPTDNSCKEETSSITNNILLTELEHSPVTAEEVKRYSRLDPIISKVIYYVHETWPDKIDEQCKPYLRRRHELHVEDNRLHWGSKVIIPFQLRDKVLSELHDSHPGITRMKALARSFV